MGGVSPFGPSRSYLANFFRWRPRHVYDYGTKKIQDTGDAWARYELLKNGREAVCVAGVNKKWKGDTAWKAPKIKLRKFPVKQVSAVHTRSKWTAEGFIKEKIKKYTWAPADAQLNKFSPNTYAVGRLYEE